MWISNGMRFQELNDFYLRLRLRGLTDERLKEQNMQISMKKMIRKCHDNCQEAEPTELFIINTIDYKFCPFFYL